MAQLTSRKDHPSKPYLITWSLKAEYFLQQMSDVEGRRENQKNLKCEGDLTHPCWLEDWGGGHEKKIRSLKELREALIDSQQGHGNSVPQPKVTEFSQ